MWLFAIQSIHVTTQPGTFGGHCLAVLQAWLVPHVLREPASIGCGLGPVAAVHSGFSASWQTGLKHAVCSILQKAVKQSHQDGSNMKLLITGTSSCCHSDVDADCLPEAVVGCSWSILDSFCFPDFRSVVSLGPCLSSLGSSVLSYTSESPKVPIAVHRKHGRLITFSGGETSLYPCMP